MPLATIAYPLTEKKSANYKDLYILVPITFPTSGEVFSIVVFQYPNRYTMDFCIYKHLLLTICN